MNTNPHQNTDAQVDDLTIEELEEVAGAGSYGSAALCACLGGCFGTFGSA